MNIKFDLIIANPPYGKRGTLATQLVSSIMNYANVCVFLCQPRSLEKKSIKIHVTDHVIIPNVFEDAGLVNLIIAQIQVKVVNNNQELFDKRAIQETDIEFWIKKYNEKKLAWRTIPHCASSPSKYRNIVETKKSFFIFGCMEMYNPITKDGNSTGYRYNVKKDPIVWAGEIDYKHPEKGVLKNGKDCYAFDCETEKAKENLISVYYEIPKNGFFSCLNLQRNEYSKEVVPAENEIPFIDWANLDKHPLWKESPEKAFIATLNEDEIGSKIVECYKQYKNCL